MKSAMVIRRAAMLFVFAVIPGLAIAGEESFEGLKITSDNSGHIASISISNPGTFLNIESEFLFSVSQNGTPTSGTITFRDKVQRPMTQGELTFYFQQYGCLSAVWDYCSQHGNTVSFVLANGKVTSEAYGKTSRIILNDGKQFVGRLGKLTDLAEGFSLTIDGASDGPVQFYNGVVKEIQQMK